MKRLTIVAAALALAACSTTYEGLRFGVGTGHSDEYVAKQRREAAARVPAEVAQQASSWAGSSRAEVIVVGEAAVLSPMAPAQRQVFYQEYAKAAAQRVPGRHLDLDEKRFVAEIGGWSTIETYGVAGLLRFEQPAAVRAADIGRIRFASVVGNLLLGATGDLVAARSNTDGLLVIERVLCREGEPDRSACAQRYAKGQFDGRGAELDSDLKVKPGGRRIDPVNYALLGSGKIAD